MEPLLASGRLFDLIIAGVVVEAVLLWQLHRHWHVGPSLSSVLPNLAAGALLMLAVRLAITDAQWTFIAATLAAALAAHLVDLAIRFKTKD